MLEAICTTSSLIKSPLSSKIPPTIVGEWSLQTNISPSSSSTPGTRTNDQARRTWFRLLFEAQAVAYTPNRPGQIGLGWYYWTWKTEWDIDTWSYRKGVADGYIPKDVSNSSTYAFPVKDNGCIDAGFEYTAPLRAGSGRMESWRVGTLLGLAFWAGVIPFWI
jgi:glucan 1,3-beta-glucosidase